MVGVTIHTEFGREMCALGYVSEKEYVLSRLALISRCDLFILKPWLGTSLYVGSTTSYPSSQAGEPREESSSQGWSRKWKMEARDWRANDLLPKWFLVASWSILNRYLVIGWNGLSSCGHLSLFLICSHCISIILHHLNHRNKLTILIEVNWTDLSYPSAIWSYLITFIRRGQIQITRIFFPNWCSYTRYFYRLRLLLFYPLRLVTLKTSNYHRPIFSHIYWKCYT